MLNVALKGTAKAMERWIRTKAKFKEISRPDKIIQFEGKNMKSISAIDILGKRIRGMKKLLEEK